MPQRGSTPRRVHRSVLGGARGALLCGAVLVGCGGGGADARPDGDAAATTESSAPTAASDAPTSAPPAAPTTAAPPPDPCTVQEAPAAGTGAAVSTEPAGGPLTSGGPACADRPALVVKVDNEPSVRVHAGLNQADVVFELYVEYASRFAAVFQSEDASVVGPVRSARTSDVHLVPMLNNPLFAYSGGNSGVLAAVGDAALVDVGAGANSGAFRRDRNRKAPHNLMTSTPELYQAAQGGAPPKPMFAYRPGDGPQAGAAPVAGVSLRFNGEPPIAFVWDAAAGRWLRFVAGAPHRDTEGVQISPENLVVLETTYEPSPADLNSPEAQTIGEGRALVFSAGHVVEGRWRRSGAAAPYTLIGPDGAPMTLLRGRTWVDLPMPGDATLLSDDAAAALSGG
ncbi:MAG: DUF3048 domain-containing protein [Acidimicrobiales bacterium]